MHFDPLQYYGADWLLFLFVLMHLWMLGNHSRNAFLFGVLACFCGFSFGLLTGSVATLAMNVVFICMHVRAYILWGRVPPIELREEGEL